MNNYAIRKKQFENQLLLVCSGDFFYAFDEDARTIADELGIVLTSKSVGSHRLPAVALPAHVLGGFVGQLIKAGHEIVIINKE